MEEEHPVAASKRNKKFFWLALPFVIGLLIVLAILASATMNEWALVTIDDKYARYLNPSIAIDAQGNQHILMGYWDFSDSNDLVRGIAYLKVADRHVTRYVLDDSQSSLAEGSISVDSMGNPHILYTTYVNNTLPQRLHYAVVENESLEIQTIDLSVSSDNIAIAVDSLNRPHIAYSTLTDIIYAHLTDTGWQKENLTADIWYTWPFNTDFVDFDVAISVDNQDTPHIAATYGTNVVCCDLVPNGSWRVTRWSTANSVGNDVDIASDSKGNTYVAFQASEVAQDPNTSNGWIYLGTLTSGGSWSFRPYIDMSSFGRISSSGHLQLAIDENDGLVICCTGHRVLEETTLFHQIDNSGRVANETLDGPGFWEFDMGVRRNGQVYLIASSTSPPLHMLTNSASLGERVSDLPYALLLEVVAGTSFVVGAVNGYHHWHGQRHREPK